MRLRDLIYAVLYGDRTGSRALDTAILVAKVVLLFVVCLTLVTLIVEVRA